MAIPSATIQRVDGGLGVAPSSVGGANLRIGVCSKGVANVLGAFGSKPALTSSYGAGPLVESMASGLDVGGGPVIGVPVVPSVAGSAGAVSHVGAGAGTVVPTLAPDRIILAKVTTGGALATAQFAFSVDGAAYGTPVVSAAGPWVTSPTGVPLVKLTFPAGTYVLNEVYTFNTDGTITQSGAGPLPTQASSPVDVYSVLVEILTGGALGTATFRYALDGQAASPSYSGEIAVPSGGKFVIPGAGIMLTFASTFVAADTYAFTTVAANATVSDIAAAIDVALADSTEWRFGVIVGTPASAAAAASLAATCKTKADAAAVAFRYIRFMIECPQGEGDATIKTAFASFQSDLVSVCVGDTDFKSVLSGREFKRNISWAAANRMAKYDVHVPPEKTAPTGSFESLHLVTKLYRNEEATPGLHDARFITGRTHVGLAGFYLTGGKTMAAAGSDYQSTERVDVMNKLCRVVRVEALRLLSSDLEVDDTGKLSDLEASRAERRMQSVARSDMQGNVSKDKNGPAVYVSIDRDSNILSTENLPIEVSAIPKGKASKITVRVGFSNPALNQ